MFKPPPDLVRRFHAAYRRKGGTSGLAVFAGKVQKFFDLTYDAYVGGTGSRTTAMAAWVGWVGDAPEARRYFDAVNSVESYT